MKTVKEIKKEITELRKVFTSKESREVDCKRATKRIRELNKCVMYLETNPRDEFIKESYESIKNRIEIIDNRFTEWINNNDVQHLKNPKMAWNTMNGVKQLKQQALTLKYLLR